MSKKIKEKAKRFMTELLHGKEVNDPQPKICHTGVNRPPTLQEQINRVLRARVSMEAHMSGFETEEEASDFDVDDDFERSDPATIYQVLDEEFIAPEYSDPGDEDGDESKSPEPEAPETPLSAEKVDTTDD